eukprot:TRINITY_DN682_c0_g1_i4.p1 TRINITY_DN682_c0_g1~~TRINITY_DN682_c0_g1_i4.p1  ORF type:complete len:502 (-),score=104.50 TRINITY_DN682_c0_g1_i4:493-1953(-)
MMKQVQTRPRAASALASIGEYVLERPIEEQVGAGGLVRMGRNKRDPSTRVVVKELQISTPRSESVAQREVDAMGALEHPHTMGLLNCYRKHDRMFIVMRYAERGDLLQYISTKPQRRLGNADAKRCFAQIVSGVSYMHDEGYIHGDLKPDNIFVDGNNDMILGDFGRSSAFERECKSVRAAVGTLQYAAPEAVFCEAVQRWRDAGELFRLYNIEGDERGAMVYGPELDMWALGATLYVMVTGYFPFGGVAQEEVMEELLVASPRYPFHVEPDLVRLLRGLLEKNPSKRWGMAKVKQCRWLRQHMREMLKKERTSVMGSSASARGPPLGPLLESARVQNNCTLLRCSPRPSSGGSSSAATPRAVHVSSSARLALMPQRTRTPRPPFASATATTSADDCALKSNGLTMQSNGLTMQSNGLTMQSNGLTPRSRPASPTLSLSAYVPAGVVAPAPTPVVVVVAPPTHETTAVAGKRKKNPIQRFLQRLLA